MTKHPTGYPTVLSRQLAALAVLVLSLLADGTLLVARAAAVDASVDAGLPADPQPLSADNPRIWPAVSRASPLPMGSVDAFAAPDAAAAMGVQWQRILFDWSSIQPTAPDQWSVQPATVELAQHERAAGRPVVGQLISSPSWASGTGDPKSPPRGLDLPLDDPRNVWATWVRSLVGRYAGAIDTWVIWNEPDVWSDDTSGRQWNGTPDQYYQLLKVAYISARRANPKATILMAGMTYWWDASYGREQYFGRVLRLAAADPTAAANNWYFDGAVLQLYNNPRGLFDAPRIFHGLMRSYGFDRPVWVNETNVVPWDDPVAPLRREHYRGTMDEQASYLVQATAYGLAAGIDRLAVYKMVDDAGLKKGVEQAFGMVRADASHSRRPVFETFRVLLQEMAPTARAQLVDEGPVNRVYLEQPALGRRLTVLWNTSALAREALVAALGDGGQLMDKFGNVRAVDSQPDGFIHVWLPNATANTLPGFPNAYFIGGEPVMVLERLPDGYQPFEPTWPKLPGGTSP